MMSTPQSTQPSLPGITAIPEAVDPLENKIMKRYNYAKRKHDKKRYMWNYCPGEWTYFEEPATPEDKQILREIALRHKAREEERNRLNTNAQEL